MQILLSIFESDLVRFYRVPLNSDEIWAEFPLKRTDNDPIGFLWKMSDFGEVRHGSTGRIEPPGWGRNVTQVEWYGICTTVLRPYFFVIRVVP